MKEIPDGKMALINSILDGDAFILVSEGKKGPTIILGKRRNDNRSKEEREKRTLSLLYSAISTLMEEYKVSMEELFDDLDAMFGKAGVVNVQESPFDPDEKEEKEEPLAKEPGDKGNLH